MLKKKTSQRGSALMLVTIIVLILSGISGAYLTISWWSNRRASQDENGVQALYIAESAAASIITQLNASGGATPEPVPKTALQGGYYWVPMENIVNFGDPSVVGAKNLDPDYFSFQVAGAYNGVVRRLDVLVSHKAGGVFWNAIFAGNDGKIDPLTGKPIQDPNYKLDLNGPKGNADIVKGDVYTAGDINAGGASQILDETGNGVGKVTFGDKNTSTVTGNYQQGTEPGLLIDKNLGPYKDMNQAEYNAKVAKPWTGTPGTSTDPAWIDVESQFKNKGTSNHKWSSDGSAATDIVDAKNPAHFMRKNPTSNSSSTNRTQSYEMTVDQTTLKKPRNDYYIEDPVKLSNGNTVNNNLTDPSLTGQAVNGDTSASMLNITPESNNAVFYVDGNLRVSGENVKSYQFNPTNGAGDIKMTFVVKGNVSLTDNLLYPKWESAKDVVAIIAIKDDVNFPNTTAADFVSPSGVNPVTPNGVTAKSFVDAYNTRASNSGGKMVPLDLNLPADQARASQEYNKIYGSGNVFFGDPGSGTVEHFEAFMYAENNFYATNLDSSKDSGGTSKVEIYGNMTAGNQVSMERATNKVGYNGYIPLRVTFDPAVRNGIRPPWIPDTPGQAGIDWHVASWKQSASTAELNNKLEKQ